MREIIEIHRYAFTYRMTSILVIIFHLLYTVFNLVSLVLFVPFLQIIFLDKNKAIKHVIEPVYNGGFINFFKFISKYYEYFMNSMAAQDPKKALYFVCFTVFISFLLKNILRYAVI